jgi:HAD superfamily hydrolase (TIGR01509 family)
MNGPGPVEFVLFDIGDTLVSTAPIVSAAADYATQKLEDEGHFRANSRFASALTKADREADHPHVDHFLSERGIVEAALRAIGESSTSSNPLAHRFLAHYRIHVRELLKPDPEVIGLLSGLRADGIRLGAVSNGRTSNQVEVLTRLGIAQLFEAIVISETIGNAKPDARPFEAALEMLGAAPSASVFVGDDLRADCIGAMRLGMRAIQATWFTLTRAT